MEDLSDPDVKDWNANQNGHTRSVLDGLPIRELVRERVASLYRASSADYPEVQFRGCRFFALKFAPPRQQRFLVALDVVDDMGSERIVVDPNLIDREGRVAIDWFTPSHDGRLVAVSLSKGGSEEGTLRVCDVKSGESFQTLFLVLIIRRGVKALLGMLRETGCTILGIRGEASVQMLT